MRLFSCIVCIGLIVQVFATDIAGNDKKVSISAKERSVQFDTLIGMLPPLIKYSKTPYLIPSNIEVPPDRTVTIEPGTVFLFRNFAGLHIRGRLIAHGTAESPIVFTSEYDKTYNHQSAREANPFDWDGIYMTLDAIGTQMSSCNIAYSVYGITSETKFIRLDSIIVKDNGKSIMTIDNIEYPLTDTTFRYVLDNGESYKDGVPINLFHDPLAKKRTAFRILGSSLIIAGIGAGGYFGYSGYKAEKKWSQISDSTFSNLNQHSSSDYKDAESKTIRNFAYSGSGALLSLLGVLCVSWTFTF